MVKELAYVFADKMEPTIEQRLEDKMPIFADEINIENAESVVITGKENDIQYPDEDNKTLLYNAGNFNTKLSFDNAKMTDECDKIRELYKEGVQIGEVDVRGISYMDFREIIVE